LRSRGFFVGSSLSKFVEPQNLGLVFHPMGRNISGQKKNHLRIRKTFNKRPLVNAIIVKNSKVEENSGML